MRISDWSSDVCSSDLLEILRERFLDETGEKRVVKIPPPGCRVSRPRRLTRLHRALAEETLGSGKPRPFIVRSRCATTAREACGEQMPPAGATRRGSVSLHEVTLIQHGQSLSADHSRAISTG